MMSLRKLEIHYSGEKGKQNGDCIILFKENGF